MRRSFDAVVLGNEGSLLPVAELIEEIAPARSIMRSVSRSTFNGLGNLVAAPSPAPVGPASP